METLFSNALALWAVWRSLDTVTGAQYDHSGMTAPQRLERWKATGADDAAIMNEIRAIYAYNPSMRAAGEPVVTVKADYTYTVTRRGEKIKHTVPAIWFSRDNPEPQFEYKATKDDWDFATPHRMGNAIVDVVRALMRMDGSPGF